jgi:putative salt-induced outer membrane protein YdiY
MLSLLIVVSAPPAHAQDVAITGNQASGKKFEAPETHLSAEFGGAWTTGNTLAWTLNGSLNGVHREKRSEFSLRLGANVGQSVVDSDGNAFIDAVERDVGYVPSAQRYTGLLRYDYYVGDRDTVYLQAETLVDRFAGFENRTQGEFGYRRLLAETDKLHAVAELGIGLAREQYVDDGAAETPDNAVFLGVAAKIGLAYKFNENVSLEEAFDFYDPFYNFTAGEGAASDFRVGNTVAIVSKLTDKFSLKVSHQLRHDNVPNSAVLSDGSVGTFRKLDQTTMATFVASIL